LTRRIYLIDCPGIVPTSAHDSQTATVLKGVLRVEALPTPSEHVSELLMRVKPLYLSRTYGLTAPESGSWTADEFLDALARAKGRLLKGGEPDIEGAAKIVLADWVRGRIPYFVAPPERPAELNECEEKERARVAKSNGRKSDEKLVPGVRQNLGSIMQKNTFVGEDVRPLEDIVLEGESEDGRAEEEGVDEVAVDGEDAEEAAPLTWGDVFVEDSVPVPAETAGSAEEEEEEEEEEWSGITSLPKEGAWNRDPGCSLLDSFPSYGIFQRRVRGACDKREGTTNDNEQGRWSTIFYRL
jgi:nuclear GTP-binding protein